MNDYKAEQLDEKLEKFMAKFFSPKVQGQLRSTMIASGVLLAEQGYKTEAYWTAAAGVVVAALAFVWSWFAPEKKP